MESVRELIEERDTLDTELNEVNEKLELMAHLSKKIVILTSSPSSQEIAFCPKFLLFPCLKLLSNSTSEGKSLLIFTFLLNVGFFVDYCSRL